MKTQFVSLLSASLLFGTTAALHAQRPSTRPQQSVSRTPATAKVEQSGGAKVAETRDSTKIQAFGGPAGVLSESRMRAYRIGLTNGAASASGTSNSPGPFDVGIIPGSDGCPSGSPLITIHLDSENNQNANSSGGWIGSIIQNSDLEFKLCRVSGAGFVPVPTGAYAVVQLGSTCPPGSVSFSRYFDDQDTGNTDWYSSSDGQPFNLDAGATYIRIYFCMFPPISPIGTAWGFPSLGIEYGVFAGADMTTSVLATGWVKSDDEDTHNNNSYGFGAADPQMVLNIIPGDRNTVLNIAKVANTPPCNTPTYTVNTFNTTSWIPIQAGFPIRIHSLDAPACKNYFVSVVRTDAAMNPIGTEVMKWLTAADLLQYGGIGNFDIKTFASDRSLAMIAGNYYKLKVAVGWPTWKETSRFVRIL